MSSLSLRFKIADGERFLYSWHPVAIISSGYAYEFNLHIISSEDDKHGVKSLRYGGDDIVGSPILFMFVEAIETMKSMMMMMLSGS